MQILLNKRLVLPFIVLLTAFNVLPVGLVSMYNMDLLKLISLGIFILALANFKGYFEMDIRYATFFFLSILFSAVNMVSKGKYMDWTFFYCLNYINLFLLLRAFTRIYDIEDYIRMLIFFCVIASFVHMIFFLSPSILDGVLTDIRMGKIHMDSSKVRIFIPGMGFIALIFSYLIAKLFYYRFLSLKEILLFFLFFASIFIFASVRTYLLGVLVTLIILLLLKKLSFKKIASFAGIAVVFVLFLSLISADLYDFLVDRFDIFLKLGDFKFMDAVNLDVDYDNEYTFGTLYFRIMEVIYVLQNFSNDMRSILFGNMGTLYDFLGVEQEVAPHVGIFAIYYLFGLVGLVTFTAFFIYYTKMIIRNLKKFRQTELEFLSIVLAIFWFTLFGFSFFGGTYYTESALLVTFTIAASIKLKQLNKDEYKAA